MLRLWIAWLRLIIIIVGYFFSSVGYCMNELLIHSLTHSSVADLLLMLTWNKDMCVKLKHLNCQVLQPKSSQRGHLTGSPI